MELFHPRLKFTVEVEEGNKLPYLDLLIIRNDDGTFDTDWYSKSICSNRMLNFASYHPYHQKKNTAFAFINRVLTLSEVRFHYNNKAKIIEILRKNNYPMELISQLFKQYYNRHKIKVESEKDGYRGLTFVKDLSENIKKVLKNDVSFNIAFKNSNTVRRMYRTGKEGTSVLEKSNVIYHIPCGSCNGAYIGQTGRKLGDRLKEHMRDCTKPPNTHMTALHEHHANLDHNFQFEEISILHHQHVYHKRLCLEGLYISGDESAVNIRSDTAHISHIYNFVIDKYSRM